MTTIVETVATFAVAADHGPGSARPAATFFATGLGTNAAPSPNDCLCRGPPAGHVDAALIAGPQEQLARSAAEVGGQDALIGVQLFLRSHAPAYVGSPSMPSVPIGCSVLAAFELVRFVVLWFLSHIGFTPNPLAVSFPRRRRRA